MGGVWHRGRGIASRAVEDNPEFNTVTLAKMLAVSASTARAYVGDILAKRRDDRASKAGRLGLLGWTQAEIASVLDVSRQTIGDDMPKIAELRKSAISLFDAGHDIDEIVMRTGLSPTHATAMILQGKDDADRMSHIGIKTQPYDVWQFPRLVRPYRHA